MFTARSHDIGISANQQALPHAGRRANSRSFVSGAAVSLTVSLTGRCGEPHRQATGGADVSIRGTYHASDANPALIGFYMCLQTNVEGLLAALRPLCTAYAKAPQANAAPNARRSSTAAVPASLEAACESSRADVYYWARHRFNHYLLHTDASVQMDNPHAPKGDSLEEPSRTRH